MPRIQAGTIAEHREHTWRALEGSLATLLEGKGLERISLREIAERAGIARNTVYNYAPDKYTLLRRVVERASEQLSARVRATAHDDGIPAADRLRRIVLLLLDTFAIESNRAFMLHAQSASVAAEETESAVAPVIALHDDIVRVLADGIAEGVFAATQTADIDVRLLTGLMASSVREIALDPDRAPVVIERALHLVLAAVSTR